jgi:tetratricopeptide (TPR) repeat protein
MKRINMARTNLYYTITTILLITLLAFLIFEIIAGVDPSSEEIIHKGIELTTSGKYDEAINAYDKAIDINQTDENF